jgi:branched-chain amino acid transport system substrate-binding protein
MTAGRRRSALLLACALSLGAGACTGGETPAASGEELRIGLLAPLKGTDARAGLESQRGAELAADIVNGNNPSVPLPLAAEPGLPGLGGAKIKIITVDTAYDDSERSQAISGASVTKLVIDNDVAALVGAHDSVITELASQRSDRFEVPFINADSPATFLTEAGRDWFFRIGPTWQSAGEAFFSLLRSKGRPDAPGRVAVLHASDKAGGDVASIVRGLAPRTGASSITEYSFPPDATNLLGVVDRMRADNPDSVFIYATPATVQPMIEAFGARQYKPKAALAFGLGYLTSQSYGPAASVISGLSRSVSWAEETAGRNLAARAVAGLYERRYKTKMSEASASSFTAVMTIAQAADAARTTQPQGLRTALLSLDVPGDQTIMPWAGIQFDETHQNVLATMLVEQFGGRAFRVVFPHDAASRDTSWQWPGPGVGA